MQKKSKEKRETEILFLFKDDKKFFVILNVHIKNRTLSNLGPKQTNMKNYDPIKYLNDLNCSRYILY